ncbi:unnamed protein product [Jaminaea pallidilutea]
MTPRESLNLVMSGKRLRTQSGQTYERASGAQQATINRAPETGSTQVLSHACKACSRSKKRCDRRRPVCSYCFSKSQPCEAVVAGDEEVSKPRKRRFPEAELLSTIKAYEAALASHGINPIDGRPDKDTTDEIRDKTIEQGARNDFFQLHSLISDSFDDPPVQTLNGATVPHSSPVRPLPLSTGSQGDKVHKDIVRESGNAIMHHFDRIYRDSATALVTFDDPTPWEPVKHPSPFQIVKLWNVYCENVYPVVRIIHAPHIQDKLYKIGDNLAVNATPADHALLCAIYMAAACSLSADELRAIFVGQKVIEVLEQLSRSTRTALYRASVFKTMDIQVLQAYILYLIPVQRFVDPRVLACYTAAADRIARRLSIHRETREEPSRNRDSVVDREIKRRLWWEIYMLESRTAQKSGAGCNAVGLGWTTRIPLCLSDSALAEMHEFPAKQTTAPPDLDAMLFVLRCEVALFLWQMQCRQDPVSVGMTEMSSTRLSLHFKMTAIDKFEDHLQQRYLVHCGDESMMGRLMTVLAKYQIARLRLEASVSHRKCKPTTDAAVEETSGNNDTSDQGCIDDRALLREVTTCIDLFLTLRTSPVHGHATFDWWHAHNMPFIAFVYSFLILRDVTSGEEADRCWEVLEKCEILLWRPANAFRTGHGVKNSLSSVGVAPAGPALQGTNVEEETADSPFAICPETRFSIFSKLMRKAWDARAAALPPGHRVPDFVLRSQERDPARRPAPRAGSNGDLSDTHSQIDNQTPIYGLSDSAQTDGIPPLGNSAMADAQFEAMLRFWLGESTTSEATPVNAQQDFVQGGDFPLSMQHGDDWSGQSLF